jgi:hypothetical protein
VRVKLLNGLLSKVNWFGFAGGITTIIMIAASMVYPWWQLTVGDNLLTANASPVNTTFGALGTSFAIPFIWALNVVSLLTLLASAVAMLIYSLVPRNSYSKHLLDFGYKKPLFIVIFFVIGLVATTLICQMVLSLSIPLMGSTTSTLSIPFLPGVSITLLLSAGFQWSFLVAVVGAALCIAARLYHKKVASVPSM